MYPTKNTGPKSASQLHLSKWSTGLCGCFEDCSSCCLTCFAPFITFGRNAEILDEGQTCNMWWREPKLLRPCPIRCCMVLHMLIPNQTESQVFVAEKTVRGFLCPFLLHLLRYLPRVPRTQAPWIGPFERLGIPFSENGGWSNNASIYRIGHDSLRFPWGFSLGIQCLEK
ncbi:uncharacterized protein LOC133861496 isoform X1 [Alnus glutinosa]|uniref:uncharacterized protein LOC133861496 isoform X1 n=1 Tax=Alnus glutinosa TaxID=3517 RepID=UPI002D77614F|nr:uncharacterized protein LOC133861496 isoform X1 [Alnus glutinosa]